LQQAEATRAAIAAAKDGKPALPDVVYSHLGAGRPVLLNPLRQQLRESEFTTWMREGIAEALFRAAPGELLPPLRGADGVYVARVVRKVEGDRKIDRLDAPRRGLLRELLVQSLFREWIDTAFASSVVRLPQDAARTRGK
jgi:hypothetical protein